MHCGDTVEMPTPGEQTTVSGRDVFEIYGSRLAVAPAAHREQQEELVAEMHGGEA